MSRKYYRYNPETGKKEWSEEVELITSDDVGTAATRDVGESSGNVMEVGAFGIGGTPSSYSTVDSLPAGTYFFNGVIHSELDPLGTTVQTLKIQGSNPNRFALLQIGTGNPQNSKTSSIGYTPFNERGSGGFREIFHTGNLRTSTGTSTEYPMTQKAVTDALNTKADKSTTISAGTGLDGGGTLASNRTLSVKFGNAAGTATEGNDSRLTNSREWTASTVSQAEAEAGTATTRRAWTAQRVRQAITAWFNGVSSSFTRTLLGRSNASQVRSDLELGTAATRDIGDSSGDVAEFVSSALGLAGYGYGRHGTTSNRFSDVNDVPKRTGFYFLADGSPNNSNNKPTGVSQYDTAIIRVMRHQSGYFTDLYIPYHTGSNGLVIAPYEGSAYSTPRIVSDSLNLRTSTGSSTTYPMTQKAVTDALNTKITGGSLVQGTGSSTSNVMSQKAVTDALATKEDKTALKTAAYRDVGTDLNNIPTVSYVDTQKVISDYSTINNNSSGSLVIGQPSEPLNLISGLQVGFRLDIVGPLTINTPAGETLRSQHGSNSVMEDGGATLIKLNSNTWWLAGNLE